MKVVIVTTPIRPEPDPFPPLGSLAVIQSLRDAGIETVFGDFDALRPTWKEVEDFFRRERPDLVGISAVVSTAYRYTKDLCHAIKRILPDAVIVVGGNLGASAEVLLRLAGAHMVALGEGEETIVSLARHVQRHSGFSSREARCIKGLCFLDGEELVNTGYPDPIPASKLFDPDFSILRKWSKFSRYVLDPATIPAFAEDPRFNQPHRRGKKATTIVTSKGCVARCTFCHRWDKGVRYIPVDIIIHRMKRYMEDYDIGFFMMGDENFGSDRRWDAEFIEKVKPLDVLWVASGVRTRTVSQELIAAFKDCGCVGLTFGMETGSPRMLEIMEKKLDLQDNINAAKWTKEAGLYTCYQLVIGMPGETEESISETIDFIKQITIFMDREPRTDVLSINYAQALPGTPLYEYGRKTGRIGPTLQDEEHYLLDVSDVDACDSSKFINFTELPCFTVQTWQSRIIYEATYNYYRKRGLQAEGTLLAALGGVSQWVYKTARLKPGIARLPWHPIFYYLRKLLIVALMFREFRRQRFEIFARRLKEWVAKSIIPWSQPTIKEYKSLRKIVHELPVIPTDSPAMEPLRKGR
jgi:radical SAM superfamily enzyme YgiQ (UPF0313 family)